jgi:uncharacterized protein YciI
MNHFLYKLVPPRPTFDRDMTESEAAIMQQHVGYWHDLAKRGVAVVFGPVGDPSGAWGLAVVETDSEQHVHALGFDDPAVKSEMATYEVCPMPGAVVRT